MVTNRKEHSEKTPVKQDPEDIAPEPNKINASTPYDFSSRNLTPYGGLLPVITMLEKLGLQSLRARRPPPYAEGRPAWKVRHLEALRSFRSCRRCPSGQVLEEPFSSPATVKYKIRGPGRQPPDLFAQVRASSGDA